MVPLYLTMYWVCITLALFQWLCSDGLPEPSREHVLRICDFPHTQHLQKHIFPARSHHWCCCHTDLQLYMLCPDLLVFGVWGTASSSSFVADIVHGSLALLFSLLYFMGRFGEISYYPAISHPLFYFLLHSVWQSRGVDEWSIWIG